MTTNLFQNELVLSSRDRISGTKDNFVVQVNNIAHIEKMSIRKIIVPLTWYQINQYNNQLEFNDGTQRSITITPGVYSISSLATEIQTQMNASPSALTFTVTFNDTTKKYTIAETSGPTAFALNLNISNSIYEIIGFPLTNQTGATSYTGTGSPNLNQNNDVVNIYSSAINRFDRRVHSSDHKGQTVREYNSQTIWGGTIDLESFQNIVLDYNPNSGLTNIDIRITDTNDNPIDFTSGEVYIYLLCYTKV